MTLGEIERMLKKRRAKRERIYKELRPLQKEIGELEDHRSKLLHVKYPNYRTETVIVGCRQ